MEPKLPDTHQTSMLTFAKDLPNICSLVGLLCAVVSMYFSILGNFPAAMIGMLWAVFFDWGDGIIARKIKNRTDQQRAFGGMLDSLIDIISFGICPAVLLLSYGEFGWLFLPGAFIIVATSAIRLSYFDIFGLVDNSTYVGLALDNNVLILALVFLLDGLISQAVFSIVLYATLMILAGFNLSSIRTPKFAGRWFYILTAYVLILTIIYGWIMWHRGN
ncbi:MAG: CDP-alcohol phosphatidyltransferase [Planctomycetes bacterium]|nr:CDP-alcohol phosphatidyltransferase [Planctomycetota bacterium]